MKRSLVFWAVLTIGLLILSPQLVSAKTVALWLCDEGSGQTLIDNSGNGHDGTLEGNAGWTDGKFGKALKLNGSPDRVVVPGSANLTGSDAMTVEFWIKALQKAGYQIPVSKGMKGPGHWEIYLLAGTGNLSAYIPDLGDFGGTNSVTDDKWHHCAMVWDGSSVILYVDGKEAQKWAGLEFQRIVADDQPLHIGNEFTNNFWFTGLMDEIRITNGALSPDQLGYRGSLATHTKQSEAFPQSNALPSTKKKGLLFNEISHRN